MQISDACGKKPSISGLVTSAVLTAVENKILDISGLVKKTDYNTKISENESKVNDHDHDEYITTSEFNKLITENFKARLAQTHLVTKTDFDAKMTSLNKNIYSSKTKHLLVENELKNCKHLIQAILKVKFIFKKMVVRII